MHDIVFMNLIVVNLSTLLFKFPHDIQYQDISDWLSFNHHIVKCLSIYKEIIGNHWLHIYSNVYVYAYMDTHTQICTQGVSAMSICMHIGLHVGTVCLDIHVNGVWTELCVDIITMNFPAYVNIIFKFYRYADHSYQNIQHKFLVQFTSMA